ncbi:MobA/MobL family protein [Bradyrhizobium sp. 30]|uniref:MobA/MobL family protein n=1 Tax=Bradyrhizobium sp. 30 TaxID=2782669 RepID=UPI001FFB825E|nr:MobA/MobL family protein [Bradyrhizobium sp. 30]MCK1293017.1 MobA/MobL family protein [Bradyrhizobium sp. 30]
MDFGFNLGLVQRSKGGSALRHSAYLRGGRASLANGSVADFSKRADVIASFIARPEGTPAWVADCAQLWKRAVAAEKRANAQEARLIELSIPRALPKEHWVELAQRLVRDLVTRGMVVQVAIHCPMASDGGPNPHIHFMATMREIVNGEFSPKKARHWNKLFFGKAKQIRRQMAQSLNQFCEEKGVHHHADPRSNAERGLPAAEVHVPRWNIHHHKRTGRKTRALEQRDEERVLRAEVACLEEECLQRERELEEARMDAKLVSTKGTIVATQPQALRFPLRNAKPTKRDVHHDTATREIAIKISTDIDLPGPRYGP